MTEGTAMSPAERGPQLILFLVNPLLLLPFVTDQALIRWLLVAISLAVSVAVSGWLAGRMWRYRFEVWPLAAFSLLIVVHLIRGAPVAESVRWLVLIVLGGLAYLYCRALGPEERDGSLGLLVMAGGAIGAYAVLQAVGLDVVPYATESWMYRVVTTFGHRNFTATFLVVVLFCGLRQQERPEASVGRWPLVWIALIYVGLLATGSRFPILAGTIALAVHFGAKRRLRWIASGAVLILAVWVVVIVARGEFGAVVTRSETLLLRADLYRSMVPLVVAEPVVGLGPGGFARTVPEAVGPQLPGSLPGLVFLHAHLLPAELAIDLGLVGLLLMLVFVLPVWVAMVRRRSLGWLGWALAVWTVINLYDVSFFSYAGWVTLWPLLAFARADGDSARSAESSSGLLWRGFVVVLPTAVVFALAPMVRSSHHSFLGASALAAGHGAESAAAYERAGAIWPLPLEERYRWAVAILRSGELAPAIDRLSAVESEAPGFSAVRYNLAVAHARHGLMADAALWNDRHLLLHPQDRNAIEMQRRLQRATADRDYQMIE